MGRVLSCATVQVDKRMMKDRGLTKDLKFFFSVKREISKFVIKRATDQRVLFRPARETPISRITDFWKNRKFAPNHRYYQYVV